MTQAMNTATSKSGGTANRVAGVWMLNPYIRDPDYDQQALNALAAILSEDGPNLQEVRLQAAEVIGHAITSAPTANTTAFPDPETLKLVSLLYGRADTGEAGIVAHRDAECYIDACRAKAQGQPLPFYYPQKIEALKEAIRKNWRYLNNINLQYCDLTGIQLYSAILEGTNFTGSDLDRANLAGSDLTGSYLYQCRNVDTASFFCTNVRDLHAYPDVLELSLAHGAVTMSGQDWARWTEAKYPLPGGEMFEFGTGLQPDWKNCWKSARWTVWRREGFIINDQGLPIDHLGHQL